MTDYSADFGPVDEDGYRLVLISGPDGYEDRQWLRHDMANQWTAQELAILNHPQRDELCEHGMSAALCQGRGHF